MLAAIAISAVVVPAAAAFIVPFARSLSPTSTRDSPLPGTPLYLLPLPAAASSRAVGGHARSAYGTNINQSPSSLIPLCARC